MTIRMPTPREVLYDWHSRALAHMQAFGTMRGFEGEITHEPQPGFFQRKLVSGGPWVPAAVWMAQYVDETGELTEPEFLMAECNGRPTGPEDLWTYVCGNPITEARYRFLHADGKWAKANAPDDPRANPTKKIDTAMMPVGW